MIDVPFATAFTLGMVATVNPCGFPMLPAYLSYFIGLDNEGATAGITRVPRALAAAGSVSIGFMAVFSTLSIPVNAGITWIYRIMPWLTIVIGIALVALGSAMLAGYKLKLAIPRLDRGGGSRRFRSMALFGVSYAVASLGCTLPLFLTVVVNRPNPASGALAVLAYGLGMSLVLMALSLTLALARGSMLARLRGGLRYMDRVAGGLLVAVGAYLVWYWAFNLSRDPSDPVGSSPIQVVEDWSFWLAAELGGGGVALGLSLAAVVAAALLWSILRRKSRVASVTSHR